MAQFIEFKKQKASRKQAVGRRRQGEAVFPRSLSENSKGSRAWGLHGERKARGGGDVHAHRRRRATQRSSCNPHAPFGFRLGRGICFVGAPRRCALTSPASRRLASAPSKPGTRPLPILGQAPSPHFSPGFVARRRRRAWIQGARPRAPQAYLTVRRGARRSATQ